MNDNQFPCSCPVCAGEICRVTVYAEGDVCDFCARWAEYVFTLAGKAE